jgi:hypothetical protein
LFPDECSIGFKKRRRKVGATKEKGPLEAGGTKRKAPAKDRGAVLNKGSLPDP